LSVGSLTEAVERIFDDQDKWRAEALKVIKLQENEIEILRKGIEWRDNIIERQDVLIDKLEKMRDREKGFWARHAVF
jgi:hypothetical protein